MGRAQQISGGQASARQRCDVQGAIQAHAPHLGVAAARGLAVNLHGPVAEIHKPAFGNPALGVERGHRYMFDPSLELIGLCGRAITVLVHAVLTLSTATFASRQAAETKRCSLEGIEDPLQDRTAPTTAGPKGAR